MHPKTVLLLALALPCLSLATQAQEPDPARQELATIKARLRALHQRLEEKAVREQALEERINQLEVALAEERRDSRERIEELEEEVHGEAVDARLEQLVNRVASRPMVVDEDLSIGGYFDIEFRDDAAAGNSTFDQHRWIIQVDADIVEDAISFTSELEIEGGGAGASFLSDNEIVIEFAELHIHLDQAFNVKAGILLVPFGRFNKLHDSPLRDLTDRPLVDRRIIPTTWGDAGVGAYGDFDLGFMGLDYDVILSNGLDDDFSSTPGGGFRGNRPSFREDNNDNKQILGRLGFTPHLELLDFTNFGLSLGHGKYDDAGKQTIEMAGVDWTLKKGPFELIGEYAVFNLERGPDEIAAGAPGGADGYYVQLNYHFFPESWRGSTAFFTEESTFTLALRYGSIDTDDSARAIDRMTRGDSYRDDLSRFTLGLNFRPVERTVVKVEYQFLEEPGGVASADNDRFVVSFATYF